MLFQSLDIEVLTMRKNRFLAFALAAVLTVGGTLTVSADTLDDLQQEQEYYEKHDHFWFVTEDTAYRYSIFACNIASPYDDSHFGVQFADDDEFMKAVDKIVETSLIRTDVKLNARDHIMTLSTCTPDHSRRNVVHGVLDGTVKLRDRHSEDLGDTGRKILSTEQISTEPVQPET